MNLLIGIGIIGLVLCFITVLGYMLLSIDYLPAEAIPIYEPTKSDIIEETVRWIAKHTYHDIILKGSMNCIHLQNPHDKGTPDSITITGESILSGDAIPEHSVNLINILKGVNGGLTLIFDMPMSEVDITVVYNTLKDKTDNVTNVNMSVSFADSEDDFMVLKDQKVYLTSSLNCADDIDEVVLEVYERHDDFTKSKVSLKPGCRVTIDFTSKECSLLPDKVLDKNENHRYRYRRDNIFFLPRDIVFKIYNEDTPDLKNELSSVRGYTNDFLIISTGFGRLTFEALVECDVDIMVGGFTNDNRGPGELDYLTYITKKYTIGDNKYKSEYKSTYSLMGPMGLLSVTKRLPDDMCNVPDDKKDYVSFNAYMKRTFINPEDNTSIYPKRYNLMHADSQYNMITEEVPLVKKTFTAEASSTFM